MAITIKIPKLLQDKTGGTVLTEVEGGTVDACIADLIRQYPGLNGMILDGKGKVLLKWIVYVNDRIAASSRKSPHPVKDGDRVQIRKHDQACLFARIGRSSYFYHRLMERFGYWHPTANPEIQ